MQKDARNISRSARDPRNAKDARNLFSSNANKSPYKCKRR